MTSAEKQQLKAKIIAELEKLQGDMLRLEEITKPINTEDMDDITRMDSIVTKSVNDAALASSKSRFASLEYALKRIDEQDFGFCYECGEEIPMPRLMAMPETIHCIHCAQ